MTAGELREFVKTKVAYFKELRGGVEFIDAIPKVRFIRERSLLFE